MVQNVEEFRSELQFKALRKAEIFQKARIQIPEVRALNNIAAVTLLSWQRDGEIGLRASNVDTAKVWVGRGRHALARVVHHGALHPIHVLRVALAVALPHLTV